MGTSAKTLDACHLLEGTKRARRLDETWEWLTDKKAMAGVTRVGNVTGLDTIGIPVWVSVRPNSRGLAVSQGKGATHEAAKVSALMESIENWHAEEIDAPLRVGSYETLKSLVSPIDPRSFTHWGRVALRDDLALTWIEGHEHFSDQKVWIPYEMVSGDYVVPASKSVTAAVFVQSSNGLAGGNTYWEAATHALSEVIERHTIYQNERKIREFSDEIKLSPDAVREPFLKQLLERLRQAGMLVRLFALGSDIDPSGTRIPVIACSILSADDGTYWRNLPPFNGYGCHLDPAIAMARAITEAAQSRLTYIAGGRDDINPGQYRAGAHPDDLVAYRKLFSDGDAGRSIRFERPDTGQEFDSDFNTIAALLKSRGYNKIVIVDLAKPDVGIPVVKVVVPGLQVPSSLVGGAEIVQPNPVSPVGGP
ncbi:YcaO-like family protein [Erythrobacter crassostreae]|uniref:YcaO-like family protein n=1 Tax=Erythrobacter crassostreae TaxID=2828328 RepID=A0A9X1F4Y1_9SPHN|nr:YcaO-like family protein [Erythrobacter crassostrea]MBV7260307.1 YcaO-like family protein [Erythrobacter crassostrea]